MEEIWKPVVGYEGYYEVSNLGRVRSVDRYVEYNRHGHNGNKKFLKGKDSPFFEMGNGYLRVLMAKNGKNKLVLVHRAVAMAFIPNTYGKSEVNHIDGNKRNNNVTNLEWTSSSENKIHAIKNNIYHNEKPVIQIKNGIAIAEFRSAMEVNRLFGYSAQGIGKVALGKRKSAYGYQWKFKEKESHDSFSSICFCF